MKKILFLVATFSLSLVGMSQGKSQGKGQGKAKGSQVAVKAQPGKGKGNANGNAKADQQSINMYGQAQMTEMAGGDRYLLKINRPK
jgi:hypothetical protein